MLVSAGLSLLFGLAREAGRADFQQLLLLLFPAYTAAILVAVWRCGEHAAAPWGALARVLTVAWALNTLLLLLFLQIELIHRWTGGNAS